MSRNTIPGLSASRIRKIQANAAATVAARHQKPDTASSDAFRAAQAIRQDIRDMFRSDTGRNTCASGRGC